MSINFKSEKAGILVQRPLTCSIITVCYNSERTIEDTFRSVAKQTYEAIEYIVVDGGSRDGTLSLIERYARHINRWVSEPDRGIYDAYNKGLAMASGDVIYFLNSDDYLHDEHVIAEVMRCFADDSSLQYVVGDVVSYDEQSDFRRIIRSRYTLEELKTGHVPQCPGFFARRTLYQEVGHFSLDYKIASDYDLIIKCYLRAADRSAYLERNISMFRVGGISTEYHNRRLMREENTAILQANFGAEVAERYRRSDPSDVFRHYWQVKQEAVCQPLVAQGVRRVAVFGSLETAEWLSLDLAKAGIETVLFLDNDSRRQRALLRDKPIQAPKWLLEHGAEIDAVVLSVLHLQDEEIRRQLAQYAGERTIPVYSFKQMIRDFEQTGLK